MTILGNQGAADHAETLSACEDAAESVILWHPLAVSELLQLPEYSQAVLAAQCFCADDATEITHQRRARRAAFAGQRSKNVTVYLGEAALADEIAPPVTMARQLRFLGNLFTNTAAAVAIRTVPSDGATSGVFQPVRALRPSSQLVRLSQPSGHRVLCSDHDGHYRGLIDELGQRALPQRDLCAAIIQGVTKFHLAS